MTKQVNSFNSYDTERSRLTGGVTNDGTVYLQLTEIFEAYIGRQPERGAKVYNNDRKIFFPLPVHLLLELKEMTNALAESEESAEVEVSSENGKRSITIGKDVDSDIYYIKMNTFEGDEVTDEIEHILTTKEIAIGSFYVGFEIIQAFLDAAKVFVFKMEEYLNDYEDSSEKPATNSTRKLGSRTPIGGNSKKLGSRVPTGTSNKKSAPLKKRSITASDVDSMLDDDDDE